MQSFDSEIWGSKHIQIEDCNSQMPLRVKSSIWMFWDPKTSKLKISTSMGMTHECLNLQFDVLRSCPSTLKFLVLMFLDSQISKIEDLNILGA